MGASRAPHESGLGERCVILGIGRVFLVAVEYSRTRTARSAAQNQNKKPRPVSGITRLRSSPTAPPANAGLAPPSRYATARA